MSDFSPTYVLDSVVTALEGTNEVQKITVKATAGTFDIVFNGETAAKVKFNASTTEVRQALEALDSVSSGDVTVTGGPGDKEGTTPYSITFAGEWGSQDVPTITTVVTNLSGEGAKTAAVTTSTAGAGNAIQRPGGLADRTDDTSLLAGSSPAAVRKANKATYGDA
jgi:hypothetical protein